jgi:hypothetical protein
MGVHVTIYSTVNIRDQISKTYKNTGNEVLKVHLIFGNRREAPASLSICFVRGLLFCMTFKSYSSYLVHKTAKGFIPRLHSTTNFRTDSPLSFLGL